MMVFYVIGIVFFLFLLLFLKHPPLFKAIIYGYPDIKDQNRNKSSVIHKGDKVFTFNKTNDSIDYKNHLVYDDWKYENALKKTIEQLNQEHKSTAFLLIKENTILIEEYYRGFSNSSLMPSYSISKSILSLLISIALDEGKIKTLEEKVTVYIPELKNTKDYDSIKLSHLLNHTTGIKNNRLLDAYLYYGNSFWKALKFVKFNRKPGTYQEYQNINAQLLGLVLYRATKQPVSKYFQEKIWKKIGASKDAKWSVFSKENLEKTFCCISATAIDYAKIGLLVLNDGKWNNTKVVSKEWLGNLMIRNQYEGSSRSYSKSWYLGLEKYEDLMAIGLYKQFIYICKSEDIIIVRLGEREKKLHEEKARWPRVFRETVDQLT